MNSPHGVPGPTRVTFSFSSTVSMKFPVSHEFSRGIRDPRGLGVKPERWAAAAVALYHALEADALVAEVNQGGDMVASVIGEVDASVPVTPVRATRGKYLRAEPVAALYAQGRVRHAGAFPALEDEMCAFGPRGLETGRSPDRLDALVWALTHLMLAPKARPRVRGI